MRIALDADMLEQQALMHEAVSRVDGDEEEARRKGFDAWKPNTQEAHSSCVAFAVASAALFEGCSAIFVVGLLLLHSIRLSVCRDVHTFDRARLALLVLQELEAGKSAAELDEAEKTLWGCRDPFEMHIPLHAVAITGAVLLLVQVSLPFEMRRLGSETIPHHHGH